MEEQLKSIKAQDIVGTLKVVEDSSEILSKTQYRVDYVALEAHLKVKEYAKKLENRETWNTNLLWMVRLGFGFSAAATLMLGFGWISFENAAVTVPVTIGAGFLETYGLAKLAVKFHFPEDKK